ncbi:adipocyte plasma membrane-associated protein-like [Haliotis rufescens]|uniref:adipocyte plasma membrane-associated protein-like n=1 Tax=Haliotis rufescens TaxID=6454 RepID=UPI00201F1804|nr:adipocyte plasma membrane-associated protein-like [Haliotis rufescens]
MESNVRQRKFDSHTDKARESPDDDAKQNTVASQGWGAFGAAFILASVTCAVLILVILPSPIQPLSYSLPPRPTLTGALTPNDRLTEAEHLFEDNIEGPESLVFDGDHLYTGTMDGTILDIYKGQKRVLARLGREPCGGYVNEPTCGRPLGMRLNKDGYLIVADAYLGLFQVNVATGDVHQIYSSQDPINGQKPQFLNDLDIASDGTIYFSDSSTRWGRRENRYCVMEAEETGRVMSFDPTTHAMSLLMEGLAFANGVQLSSDEDFLLVCETTKARIWRYWLKGSKAGQKEVFMENLPGLPDNIRRNRRGTFWVGFATVRRAEKFSMLDFTSDKPWLRSLITKIVSQETIVRLVPKYGLLLEVDKAGQIVQSLHDPMGTVVPSVSEVEEKDGVLYLGSYNLPFLSRLRLKKTGN